MAGRQLQRLLKDQLAEAPEDEDANSTSEESEDEALSKPAFNPFDLLTEEDGDKGTESEVEEDTETEIAIASEYRQSKQVGRGGRAALSASAAAKSKGKASAEKSGNKAGEEDIDAILEELNITPLAAAEPSGSVCAAGNAGRSLLSVNATNMKADEELRRMFGSMGMGRNARENEDPAAAYAGASRRVRRLAARGLLRPAHTLRPGILINPRDTWPRLDGGVFMKFSGPDSQGNPTFSLSYSSSYSAVQDLYEECQATFDPNAVAALLRSHPYHLDALLTMADVYKAMGENSAADEVLEQCVYALEMGWPPGFMAAATTGSARVPYDETNAVLFTGLFRYIQSLGRRGLHRTALEVCKLLLQLDSDDPMGVLQMIDYCSVRSGQYEYLQRFVEGQDTGGDSATSMLPNMVYSLALARWQHEQHEADKASSHGKKGKKGKERIRKETEETGADGIPSSEDLLVKAVLLHPLVVVKLQRKLAEQGVGKDSRWTQALGHPLLANASDGGNPGLGHLVDIFIERQSALWKAGPVQEWLYGGVRRACGVNAADLPGGLSAADWAAIREQSFPPSEANAYCHLRIHEFSDSAARLPPEEMHGVRGVGMGAGGEFDEAAMLEELERVQQQLAAQGAGLIDELRDANPLVALLRSLLPWNNAAQQPDYGEQQDPDQPPGGARNREAEQQDQEEDGEEREP